MHADHFRMIRELYKESQLDFGRRLGFEGGDESTRRAVRRYESGETPIRGAMLALMKLLEQHAPK